MLEYQTISVTNPAGAWTRLEATDVPPDKALLSLNAEYQPGSVGTRKGFAEAFNPNEPVASMFNWVAGPTLVSAAGNSLLYYSPTSGKVRMVPNLAAPVPFDLYTQGGAAGAFLASGGTRVYSATFDANGAGLGPCRVVGIYGAAVNTDTAFLGPITAAPALSAIGSGLVTRGTHRVGYIIETRNGFIGKLCPCDLGGEFLTSSAITVAAGKKIRAVINPAAWPTEASKVHVFMSPVINPNQYLLVPGAMAAVPGGLALPVTIDIDINDDDLLSTGRDITEHASLFTATPAGAAPFNPFVVLEHGNRIVYLTDIDGVSQAYISEPERPQHITADQHVKYLPGFRQMKTGFSLRGGLYLLGPHWTYVTEDNGGKPVEWPDCKLVDGTIGAMGPRCVTTNASQGFAAVAHVTGLYIFAGGTYQTRPLSYYVEPEWKRINWNAAATVQVLDDKDKQQLYVLAPLDGATQPTHILMWDYADGLTPEKAAFSLWNLAGYNPGAGCVVQNPTTKQLELWLGNSVAGKVLRQMGSTDAAPYNDDGGGIGWTYQTALLPGMAHDIGTVYGHYAVQFRAHGAGTLSIQAKGIDNVRVSNVMMQALTAAPAKEYTKRYYRDVPTQGPLISESASYLFATSQPNEWCGLSSLQHNFREQFSHRT
jgi:hypothetical protein